MSTLDTATSETSSQNEEEGLRNELRAAMQSLKRREPLNKHYDRLLMSGVVASTQPLVPSEKKFYRYIGSNLRSRVEKYIEETTGKDPFDKITQRQPISEEHMRNSLTLREGKEHEQKALLEMTVSSFPKHNNMDFQERRKYLKGIVMGLQLGKAKPPPKRKTPTPTAAQQTELSRLQAEREHQVAAAKAREEARKQRDEEDRKQREEELKRKKRPETPQEALHKLYSPIFKNLWEMEFPLLANTNPFRMVIDRDNCASVGAADYFQVIETPMNLTYIKNKVEAMEYQTLQQFFDDVELMIKNARLYNSHPQNPYRMAAEELHKRYTKLGKRVLKMIQKKKASQSQGDR